MASWCIWHGDYANIPSSTAIFSSGWSIKSTFSTLKTMHHTKSKRYWLILTGHHAGIVALHDNLTSALIQSKRLASRDPLGIYVVYDACNLHERLTGSPAVQSLNHQLLFNLAVPDLYYGWTLPHFHNLWQTTPL